MFEPPPFTPDEEKVALTLPRSPHRLHPLSPLVRVGRATIGLVYVVLIAYSQSRSGGGGGHDYWIDYLILGLTVTGGAVSWWVTRWWVEGSVLEVATGLIRRKVVRVPLARVQAVDLVEPWLARLFGLAEVRVRTGGASDGDARLQYLRAADAQAVRTALVALAHGLPQETAAAPERVLVKVDNGLLVLSSLLSGRFLLTAVSIAGEVALAVAKLAVLSGSLVVYVLAVVVSFGRRIANQFGLTVSESPDGLRITAGAGSRVRETIPARRIQALHRVEPLLWRLFGWQSLQLHLAGGVSRRRSQPSSVVRRDLLPVGDAREADQLLELLLGRTEVAMGRPPRRGLVRSPLSYHFLAAGHDATTACSSSGRVCRRTEFVPLAKVQSIHYVQGPVLRALRLATVKVHAAGRGATVEWRQWDADEAAELVASLTSACAEARRLIEPSSSVPAPGAPRAVSPPPASLRSETSPGQPG